MIEKNPPESHVEDSQKLEADAIVDLFEITLNDTVTKIYMKMNSTVDYQGKTYQGTLIKIDGVASYADDQVSRPKLSVWNPEGVFSSFIDQGLLDNGRVKRIRVLKEHLDNNVNISRTQQWRITRVASNVKPIIVLELRDMLDGQMFLTPARMFIPPTFPVVSL